MDGSMRTRTFYGQSKGYRAKMDMETTEKPTPYSEKRKRANRLLRATGSFAFYLAHRPKPQENGPVGGFSLLQIRN